MASYLQIENISKSYGPKVLFENIGLNVNEGDKIALVAPNGSGKTSLMRILAGKDKSDSGGKIIFLKDIRIAFLEQEYDFDPEATVLEQTGDSQRAREILTNFRLGDFSRRMKDLSGGEVKRVALSQLLAKEADFLIMDEPTNHLDIEAIEYLESFLSRSRCTLLMVTHDRYFLDRVCNIVMELDHGAIYPYRGNYQNFLEKREERIANYNSETDKVRNLLRRELEWIHATPCARSGKAKYRINAFHELSERASQAYVTKQISMAGIGSASRLGTKIINCTNLSYYWGDQCMLKDFTYNFQRYDKLGIVGCNGVGKSTFLDLLTADDAASLAEYGGRMEGKLERGESLKIGYYHQKGISFKEDDTVLDICPDTRLLGRFMFTHDMLSTRIGKLSGGEKRRLYLLTILMKEPNLLILDEPTNDLDIVTLDILEEYLQEFGGSLIVVSHDRHFLDRIADHLLVFCGDGVVKDFVGKFSEYRAYIKEYESGQKSAVRETKPRPAPVPAVPKQRRLSWKEQKELEALETELPALEKERASLESEMSSGSLSYDALMAASERVREIIRLTDEKESRWLELSELS